MNMHCKPTQRHNAMTISKFRPHTGLTSPFDHFTGGFFGRDISHLLGHDDVHRSTPSVNILEREGSFELSLLAPGFNKEDLKLNVESDTLTISAEKKNEELKENERYTRREFRHSAFARSFRLPEAVSADKIVAEFTNGVLHVSIPKAEVSKPKSHEITIS